MSDRGPLEPGLFEELKALTDASLRGEIDAVQTARLEQLLRDGAAMDLYLELVWESYILATWAKSSEQEQPAVAPIKSVPRQAPARRGSPMHGFFRQVTRPLRRYRGDPRFALALVWISTLLFAGVVAGVVAAVTVMFRGANVPGDQQIANQGPVQPSVPAVPVARLNRVFGCVWSADVSSPSVGDDLLPGRKLVLKAGLAEIVFRNGVQAIVEGPAVFEVSSRTSGRLSRGKCAMTVEDPSARGFEVDVPGMKYTDLGTEFGVLVAPGGVQEMHVFRGKVQAEQYARSPEQGAVGSGSPLPAPRSMPLIVSAHEAIRVAAADASGGPLKPIEHIAADEKQFVRNDRLTQVAAQQLPAFRRWKQFSDELGKRPDLLAYYDFQPDQSDRTVLRNRASTGPQFDGKIAAGTEWCEGRIAGKQALRFQRHGDGVRVNIPVDGKQLTLLAWVKLDPLPNPHLRAILTSDTWHERGGSVHWQLRSNTTFDLDVSTAAGASAKAWTGVFSFPGAVDQWGMFAETYDVDALQGCAYFDAKLVGKDTLVKPSAARIGQATIGSFIAAAPNETENADRTLVGRIDELMIFRTALSAEEIVRIREGMAAGN